MQCDGVTAPETPPSSRWLPPQTVSRFASHDQQQPAALRLRATSDGVRWPEGQKVEYQEQQDRKSGKMSACDLKAI
jgi:hypothetical protein